MVLVFDLDDTLYDETTFVHSGFKAVAAFLYEEFAVPAEQVYSLLAGRLSAGRGRIFDEVLGQMGIFSRKNVGKCLAVYRSHKPDIALYRDAEECLRRFRQSPLYIVTDGNKLVQQNKLSALGLPSIVKSCFITHRYGLRHAKPSPYCFLKICERERVQPQQVVYIGDNPHKDFVGIKALGFKTVRILRGHFKDILKEDPFEADRRIESLDALTEKLLREIFAETIGDSE
jgi:putative hydrolase of the HAD superfamily